MKAIEVGTKFEQIVCVQDKDSAKSLGSGGLNVFGTPAMIALMENTALVMVRPFLDEGEDTVGIEISAKHIKASAIGENIRCVAQITSVEGRKVSYQIEAFDSKDNQIGSAVHDRFVINCEKFMSKL